jgi:hypothetical protein
MAPRFHRRRDDADEDADPDLTPASLDDDEHAWWAQRDLADVWSPREPPPPPDRVERDVLAEHFGADWRTSFGFDDPARPIPPGEPGILTADGQPAERPSQASEPVTSEISPPPADTSDPYVVLDIDPSATWEEIVAAHRAMARRHHPDRLFGQSSEQVEAAEEWIRAINAAFAELRVRRDR